MPLIEKRYAEALVGIASQAGSIEAYQQELEAIVEVYNKQEDFRVFLSNPEIKIEEKKEVIKKIFDDKIRKEVLNFLMLLVDKERIKFLPGVLKEFVRMADRKKNILNMTIISSVPLDGTQIEKIKVKYLKMYKASSVRAEVAIDRSLVGGIKVKIGDKVIDGSIKGRLESLKELIIK